MKKYFSYLTIILLIFITTGCLEEGVPLFSLRNIHNKIMVTNDSAYLHVSANLDTVTFKGLQAIDGGVGIEGYAEVEGDFYEISDSVELVAYGHCWRINSTEDTTILLFPIITDSKTYFNVGSDTANVQALNFKSGLTGLEIQKQYFVRSFVVTEEKSTGRRDTGYNQVVIKFNSKLPQDFWLYSGDINSGMEVRENAVSFVLNEDGKDYAYITTGYNGFQLLEDTWRYDNEEGTWQQKAPFGGVAREKAVGFVLDKGEGMGEEAYVGSGVIKHEGTIDPDEDIKYDFYKYRPYANTWSSDVAPLPVNINRYDAVGFSLTVTKTTGEEIQRGYIAFGKRRMHKLDIHEYNYEADTVDSKTAWIKKKSYPDEKYGVKEAVVAVVDNVAVIGFGLKQNKSNEHDISYTNDFYIFDPSNTSSPWRSIPNCPGEPRANAIAFGMTYERDGMQKNMVYVGTGRGDNLGADTLYNDLWGYDLNQNEWLPKSEIRVGNNVAFAREGAVAFAINKEDVFYGTNVRGFVATGRNKEGTSGMTKMWEYLP